MKVIIVGSGQVGLKLTEQMALEGHNVVLVDSDDNAFGDSAEGYDVQTVTGNGSDMELLKDIGAGNADLLIAVTATDELNILCCLTANHLGCAHTVARVRSPEYSASQLKMIKEKCGINMTVNPEKRAAEEITNILSFPSTLSCDKFPSLGIEITAFKIDEDSPVVGKSLFDIRKEAGTPVLVCAVDRDGEVSIPKGRFEPQAGDILYATATKRNLKSFLNYMKKDNRRSTKIALAGGGRISYYLASTLLESGMNVTIVEQDAERCAVLSDKLPKARIIKGDATKKAVYDEEISEKVDTVVSLLDMDEANILLTNKAQEDGVVQTFAKIEKYELFDIFKKLSVKSKSTGVAICPQALLCEDIITYVSSIEAAKKKGETSTVLSMHRFAGIDNESVEALHFKIDGNTHHLHNAFKNIRFKTGVLVAFIKRDNDRIFPDGDTCFEIGDQVVVIAMADERIRKINDIFEED